MRIVVMVDGNRIGPLELDDLKMAIRRGEFSSLTPALVEGQNDWTELYKIPELQADLAVNPKALTSNYQWYYLVGDQETGPNTTEEIQNLLSSGTIPASTYVFREGMKDWSKAESLEEFDVHATLGVNSGISSGQQSVSVPSENPIDAKEHNSLWRSLWNSFKIGQKKAVRHKLISIDLRKARLALGESAFKQNLFKDRYQETYDKIEAIIGKIRENEDVPAVQPTDTLSKDVAKQLLKSKNKIQVALFRGELQTAFINFADVLRKEQSDCELLRIEFANVDSVCKTIVQIDQQLMDYSRDAGFLVRHPSLLFGSIIVAILLFWVGFSEIAYRRSINQAYSDAHRAAMHASQQLEANQNDLQTQQLRLRQQELTSRIKFDQMRSNLMAKQIAHENARIEQQMAEETRRELAADSAQLKTEQKQAQVEQEQLILSEYADKCFSQLTLTPLILADQSLGYCSTTIEGARYNAIHGFYTNKDWLGLISFLNPHHRTTTSRRDERDYSRRVEDQVGNVPDQTRPALEKYPPKSAIDEAVDNLLRSEFSFHLQSSRIPHRPIAVVLFDDEGFMPLKVTDVEKHPTKPGWIVTFPCRIKTIIVLVVANPFSIQHEIQPFNSYFERRREALKKLKALGEITDDDYPLEIEKERNTVFERFKSYLESRPAQY